MRPCASAAHWAGVVGVDTPTRLADLRLRLAQRDAAGFETPRLVLPLIGQAFVSDAELDAAERLMGGCCDDTE